MKILQINKYYFIKGGADSMFFNTTELLIENGHQVIPFSINHPKNKQSEYSGYFANAPEIRDLNVIGKVKSIPRFFMNKDAAKKIELLIQREKPDIAHIHNLFNGISLSILPILKKYKIPIIVTMHDTRFICASSYFNLRGKLCQNCVKSLYTNCIIHKCYQDNLPNSILIAMEMFHKEFLFDYNCYIDKYLFVSHQYMKLHSIRHSYFQEKGTVLYNFSPYLENVAPNNKKGGYLFYFGRITIEKGIVTLIKAISEFPQLKLKVAGTGPILDQLQSIAGNNVEFLGFITGEKLFDNLQKASFVIVPSEWEENNPLTIIESYSYGKPVLGANIGGIPEIITEGETGFTFESNNVESLTSAISKTQEISSEEYSRMSQNAREFAVNNFSPLNHYSKLMRIYNEAIVYNENN